MTAQEMDHKEFAGCSVQALAKKATAMEMEAEYYDTLAARERACGFHGAAESFASTAKFSRTVARISLERANAIRECCYPPYRMLT